MRRVMLLAGVAALGLYGCGDGGTNAGKGDLVIDEPQLDFGAACRVPSDPLLEVEVSTRTLHLSNLGRAPLTISQFELDASATETFVYDPATVPTTLASLETAEIVFTFVPKVPGSAIANLTIRADEAEPQIVRLLGEGKSLPPTPRFSMSCPGGAFANTDGCLAEQPNIFFATTPEDSSTEMVISVVNDGCPLLTISGIEVLNETEELAFALSAGQAPELRLPAAGQGEIRVSFLPPHADLFKGTLRFTTTDPDRPSFEMALKGQGSSPTLEVFTARGCQGIDNTCCDFKPLVGPCDGRFTIRNSGAEPLTVGEIKIEGQNPMYQLTQIPAAGTVIEGFGELENAIVITYAPQHKTAAVPSNDFLAVDSSGGARRLELRGGSPAVIETDPANTLDFGLLLPLLTPRYLPITVTNVAKWNQQLPLLVSDITLEDVSVAGVFSLAAQSQARCEATLKSGDTLQPGEKGSICVMFRSEMQGAELYDGTLVIRSGDPNYPDGSAIGLLAGTVCNGEPQPELSVVHGTACPCEGGVNPTCVENQCHSTTTSFTLDLAELPDDSRSIVLSAEQSYDLMPDVTGRNCTVWDTSGIASYGWQLLSKPAGSTGTSTPDPTDSRRTTVTFDRTGTYLIESTVTDKTGMKKSVNFTLTVTKSI